LGLNTADLADDLGAPLGKLFFGLCTRFKAGLKQAFLPCDKIGNFWAVERDQLFRKRNRLSAVALGLKPAASRHNLKQLAFNDHQF